MKRITYILVLVIIYLISGARSCTNDADFQQMKEEKSVLASVDSIKKAFVVGSPDDQHLRALETTAKQKLIDFTDYLKIASDSSLDKTFRHQAIEMAGKLFISGKAETRNWSKAYPGLNLPELEALPGKNLSGGIPCSLQTAGILVRRPLTSKNDSTFTGALSFYQECEPDFKSNKADSLSGVILINIYALKVVKSFGKERFPVWEVFLGDFNQNP